ncbi:MAG: hypothetical protein ACK5MP_04360 [Nostocoides sp.]
MSGYAGRHRGRHRAPQSGVRRWAPPMSVVGRGLTRSVAVLSAAGAGASLVASQDATSSSVSSLVSPAAGVAGQRGDVVGADGGVLASESTQRGSDRTSRSAPRVSAPLATGPITQPLGTLAFTAVAKPAPAPSSSAQSGSARTTAAHGVGVSGLTGNARMVLNSVLGRYGQITSVIGVRPDSIPDHPSGRAVDFMIPNWSSAAGADLGNQVAAYVQANASAWNVDYIIFRQRIWFPGSGWRGMSDRGGATANHMDHVHVSVRS